MADQWIRYPCCATCNRPIVPAADQCRAARVLRSYMETCDCEEPVPRGEAWDGYLAQEAARPRKDTGPLTPF